MKYNCAQVLDYSLSNKKWVGSQVELHLRAKSSLLRRSLVVVLVTVVPQCEEKRRFFNQQVESLEEKMNEFL